jgi:hypothetical protein
LSSNPVLPCLRQAPRRFPHPRRHLPRRGVAHQRARHPSYPPAPIREHSLIPHRTKRKKKRRSAILACACCTHTRVRTLTHARTHTSPTPLPLPLPHLISLFSPPQPHPILVRMFRSSLSICPVSNTCPVSTQIYSEGRARCSRRGHGQLGADETMESETVAYDLQPAVF